MSTFKKLSHSIYQCKYHVVWCPKYRYRILTGAVKDQLERDIRGFCGWKEIEVAELSIQEDHVHAVLEIPPKYAVSEVMGFLKGKTAIKIFKTYKGLRSKPYWGNHFWSRGYCVSTVGLDEEKIRKYVKYQETKEKEEEEQKRQCSLF